MRKFESKYLGQLIRLSKIRNYDMGEPIIKEGGQDQWIYFLLSGRVRIEKNGVNIATIDTVGEIFGEMRLLDGLARSASVYADTKPPAWPLTLTPTTCCRQTTNGPISCCCFIRYFPSFSLPVCG